MSIIKRLIKPVVAAVALVLIITTVTLYILPHYIYINPFSDTYASGVVYYKNIEMDANNQPKSYLIYFSSIAPQDPWNNFYGDFNVYNFSKADWDIVSPGDPVTLRLLPNAQAEIVTIALIPSPPGAGAWQNTPENLPLTLAITSDKPQYALGENASFTVRLRNDLTLAEDTPFNVSLELFKDCIFYVVEGANGKLATSNDDQLQYNESYVKSISIQPNQEVTYLFNWELSSISSGTYWVRAYIGYYPPLEGQQSTLDMSVTLTTTMRIDVTK